MGLKKKRVKVGEYVDFNGIKLSPRFFDVLSQDPCVSIGFDSDVPYEPEHPWVFDEGKPVETLHGVVWDLFKSHLRPRRSGEVIHHKDLDVMNATIENLGIGTPTTHGKAHADKRQKFRPRKRWRLFGFFRPRAEEPIRELDGEELETYRAQLIARERAKYDNDQLRLRWSEWIKSCRANDRAKNRAKDKVKVDNVKAEDSDDSEGANDKGKALPPSCAPIPAYPCLLYTSPSPRD